MSYKIWSELTTEQQSAIIRLKAEGMDNSEIAAIFNLNVESLSRKLRSLFAQDTSVLDVSTVSLNINSDQRVFVYSDTHFGTHDPVALNAALVIAEQFDPDIIINMGDTLDAHRLSDFKKDPRAYSIQQERDAWYDWAEKLNRVTNATSKYILIGNHDQRYISALIKVDGIVDMPEASISALLYTDALGYHAPVDVLHVNKRGDDDYPDAMVYFLHGQFARRYSGESTRSTSEMFSGTSTVVGHAHKTALYTRRTARGTVKCYEIGTLGMISPQYHLFPDWSQSVATGVIGSDYYDLQLHVIDRGVFFYNGKQYNANGGDVS